MQIIVKQLRGNREVHCQIAEDGSVADLKLAIEHQMNVAVDDQRLVYKGKILQGSSFLSDYGLSNGSKVHLTAKTRAPTVSRPVPTAELLATDQQDGQEMQEHDAASNDHMANLKQFLLRYFNSQDADRVVQKFREEIEQRVASMNLDEIERLAMKRMAIARGEQ